MATSQQDLSFEDLVERFQNHILTAADEFFETEGIRADWITYFKQFSTDSTIFAREVICYAGNRWPEAIEKEALDIAA
jgi:hypothetical protein